MKNSMAFSLILVALDTRVFSIFAVVYVCSWYDGERRTLFQGRLGTVAFDVIQAKFSEAIPRKGFILSVSWFSCDILCTKVSQHAANHISIFYVKIIITNPLPFRTARHLDQDVAIVRVLELEQVLRAISPWDSFTVNYNNCLVLTLHNMPYCKIQYKSMFFVHLFFENLR